VTDQKFDQFSEVLENMNDSYFAVDKNWRFTFINKQCEKIAHLKREEILGKDLRDVLTGWGLKDSPIWAEYHKTMLDRVFTQFKKFDSERELWFQYHAAPTSNGGMSVIFTDITHCVQLQNQIVEGDRVLEQIFAESSSWMAFLSLPDFRFQRVNRSYLELIGKDESIIGKTVLEVLPEIEAQGFVDILEKIARTGESYSAIETPIGLNINGIEKIVYIDFVQQPLRRADGSIYGIVAQGQDVSERVNSRKAIEVSKNAILLEREKIIESQLRYQLLFDYSPLPKWIFDLETLRFMDVNYAAIKLYGYSKDEFLQMSVTDIRLPEVTAYFYETITAEKVRPLPPIRHMKKDGSIIVVEISAFDVTISGRKVRICALIDMTERAANEIELQELLVSLQLAKEDAERANRLKSAFLANMSHEIRTPLGAIVGFTDLLRDPSLSKEEHSNYIKIVTRNGEQLSAIINDILDLSKVEAGHLTLEFTETRLDEIVTDVVSLLRVKANEKDLALEYLVEDSAIESIVTDSLRLRQILMNIIGNAVKFTHAGSVKVRRFSQMDATGGVQVFFEVSDTGIGVPTAEVERIFEAFVQADGTLVRRFGGTGLGLALSRQLARSLSGDVVILQTAVNKGSTFLISVPDQPQKKVIGESHWKEMDGPTEIAAGVLDGVRVLIVDDSPDNRKLIWHFLTKYGAIVDFAENGLLGCNKALLEDFDVVLMDIQMPVMDGYTATQKLREAGYRKPIIALTAHAMSEVRKKCLNVGCTDHLTKPIKPIDLISAISKYAQLFS